ncbi:uncharacterized protein LOC132716491 [Ruditapes philippinarum]|uniref:uncharacterized protein LOC132716491 n=1 Tax=Ruditapes philippinarum TaxID=129788 RepID=UPI00295AD8D6|nr:uncharacterized protein LOC132716491 [Ruditapes philippinarum]XP_060555759.1 uncharacterized protein LOC132716491 [Ruditapes philippinarum]
MGRGDGSGWGSGWGCGGYKGKTERVFFPAMPIPLAILCCVFNFLIPGLGSAIAGVSVFCCARNEDMDKSAKALSCVSSCGVGFLQLVTTVLLFVGWFWSCFWGVTYLMMSIEYYHNNKIDDYDRGTAITSTVSGTQTVYENGSSTPSAIIIQPAHLPFQLAQPGTQPAACVTKQQSVQLPPPYPGVEDIGTAPPPPYGEVVYQSGSVYPNPPPALNANGSEHKVGL